MDRHHLDQLRQLLLDVPYTLDPREVCPGPLSNVGFAAGRYAMAQEVLRLLEQDDSSKDAPELAIDLRDQVKSLYVIR